MDYLLSLARCLHVLHSYDISHRDVKPSNFLYRTSRKKGFIIDFSLCELSPKALATFAHLPGKKQFVERILRVQERIGRNKFGTEGYMPLETVLMEERQSNKVDVWAFGIICLQIFLKKNFLFCPLPLMVPDQEAKKPVKSDNNLAHFLIQLAALVGPAEVKKQCGKLGYFVSFPSGMNSEFDMLRPMVAVAGFEDWAWDLVKRCLALDSESRCTMFEAYKVLEEKV